MRLPHSSQAYALWFASVSMRASKVLGIVMASRAITSILAPPRSAGSEVSGPGAPRGDGSARPRCAAPHASPRPERISDSSGISAWRAQKELRSLSGYVAKLIVAKLIVADLPK